MLIPYILQVTLCLGFFYGLYHFVLQKETLFNTNRTYLLGTLLAALILPLLRIYIQDQWYSHSIVTAPYVYVGAYLNTMNEVIVMPHKDSFPWLSIVTSLYISGVIFLTYRIIVSVAAILKMKRDGEKKWLYNQRCVLSSEVKSPFSFINTVYLPLGHQFNEEEMKEIISHEKTHVLGLHTFDVLFMELVCIGLWPSPMVYLYRKKLREVHEFLADAEVVKDTPWESYASFLVAQKNEGLQHRLSNQLIYSQLKNRLIMMNKERSFQSAKFKYFGIIPILLLALVIFAFREKSIPEISQIEPGGLGLNIYKDGLKVYTDSVMSADSWAYKRDSSLLVITEDKRYFLNRKEIRYELLEQALTKAVNNDPERTIYIYSAKHSRVGDFDKFYKLEVKLKARFIYIIPELNSDRANIYLGTDKIQSAAVVVKSGNKVLKENEDYEIDYATGKMKIINEAYLQSGMPINVSFNGDTLPTTTIVALKLASEEPASSLSKNNPGTEPFTYVEEMPHFPGENSTELMYKFISNTIKYPSVPNQNIEGMGIVQFVVEADGSISRIKVVRSPNQYITDELMRVMNVMAALPDKWVPGRHNGIAVPVSFTLPVKFVMPADSKKEELAADTPREEVFQQVEEMPRFPGCENGPADTKSDCASQAMFKYIYEAIKYPAEDRQKGNEGMVIAKFVVEPDGSISNARVVRGISEGLNAEILRVINGMNDLPEKWIPGRNEGEAVPVEFVLPFKFVLQADQKQVIKKYDPAKEKDQEIKPILDNKINDAPTEQKNEVLREIPLLLFRCPNPVNDILKVEFFSWVKNVSIFNESGQLMWSKKLDNNEHLISVDVNKWAAGQYIIQGVKGQESRTTSFVVQH